MADIFDTTLVGQDCSTYIRGLTAVPELEKLLRNPGSKLFTIFAPSDAAFASLDKDWVAELFAHPEKLEKVIKYHIVPEYYRADDLLDQHFLKTLEGQRLRVWSKISEVPMNETETTQDEDALSYISTNTVTTAVRESITINGARVLEANMITDNGVLHVIDKVLVPLFFTPSPGKL